MSALIGKIETSYSVQHKLTVEKKIEMLEEAICKADVGSAQWQRLMREHGELSGHYIQKSEVKHGEIDDEEQEYIDQTIRDLRNGSSN